MMKSLLRLSIIISITLFVSLSSIADDEAQIYESMINAFLLGLEDRGREIAHDILSNDQYGGVQEQTMFFIAEKFLIDAIRNDDIEKYRKAHRLYSTFQQRFPDSEYLESVTYRKNFIEAQREFVMYWREFDTIYNAEIDIIRSKLAVAELFLQLHYPNPYELFAESRYNQDGLTIMNKYLSDIMINHPLFEVDGYYLKILIELDIFDGVTTISEGIAPLNPNRLNIPGTQRGHHRRRVVSLLEDMSEKYPSHPLTLDLHLLFAKIFMDRSRGSIDRDTLSHLQYILQNDPDQLSPRYLLAREFIENNSFQDE